MTRSAPLIVLTLLCGCDWSLQRMMEQERCAPGKSTPYLAGGVCGQRRPEGVVALRPRAQTGEFSSARLSERPEVTLDLLKLGRARFETFCSPCHGLTGFADTQVAENMSLRRPPSLHEPRIVQVADEHIFTTISEGYGLMPSYAHALREPAERWAVVAYVRALEKSQHVALAELPPEVRSEAQKWLR
jgi:mono/diheme cytochrome c family protein